MQKNKKYNNGITEKLHKILDSSSYKNIHSDDRNLISLKDRLEQTKEDDNLIKKVIVKRIPDGKFDLKPKVTIHVRAKEVIKTSSVKIEVEETIELKEEPISEDKEFFEVEKVKVEGPNFIEVKPKTIIRKEQEDEFKEKKSIATEGLTEWEPIDMEKKEKPAFIKSTEETVKPIKLKEQEKEFEVVYIFCTNCGAKIKKDTGFCPMCGRHLTTFVDKKVQEDVGKIEKKEEIVPEFTEEKEPVEEEKIIEWEPIDEPEEEIKEEFPESELKPEEETKEQIEPTEELPELESTIEEEPKEEMKEQIETKKEFTEPEFTIKEESITDIEFKLEPFKDMKTIDEKTAIILYDRGITSKDALEQLTLRELIKIKGIKRKTAKKIKQEIDRQSEWMPMDIPEKKEEELVEKTEEISIAKEQIELGEDIEEEIIKKQIEFEESGIQKDEKINVFKNLKSIDNETAILLFDNGYTSIDSLKMASFKDLTHIKGMKRRTAKKIKKEIENIIQQSAEVKPISPDITSEGEFIEESIQKEKEIVKKEEIKPTPVELSSINAEWEPVESEEPEEKIEENIEIIKEKPEEELQEEEIIKKEEQISDIEFKLKPFKNMKTIDEKTAVILYDNGITSRDELEQLTLKELTKIKEIKRKTAKKIIREIEDKIFDKIESTSENDISDEFLIDEEEKIESDEIDDNIKVYKEEIKKEDEIFIEEEENEDLKISEKKDKFNVLKTVDERTSKLLTQNGINTIEKLNDISIDDLVKIRGIKRRKAKEIKKEVYDYLNRKKESKDESFNRDNNPYIKREKAENEWESFDEEKISESELKEIKGYQYKGYTLFKKEIITKSGDARTVRFFSKAEPEKADPIELPKGYEVKENKKTGIPYLKKKE